MEKCKIRFRKKTKGAEIRILTVLRRRYGTVYTQRKNCCLKVEIKANEPTRNAGVASEQGLISLHLNSWAKADPPRRNGRHLRTLICVLYFAKTWNLNLPSTFQRPQFYESFSGEPKQFPRLAGLRNYFSKLLWLGEKLNKGTFLSLVFWFTPIFLAWIWRKHFFLKSDIKKLPNIHGFRKTFT